MVSSTTPRFGPRWPPLVERTVISSSRISAASCSRSGMESRRRSSGESIVSSMRCIGALVITLRQRLALRLAFPEMQFLESKEDEVKKYRRHHPGEKKHGIIPDRNMQNARIPEHLEQRVIASHGGLIGQPHQKPCQPASTEAGSKRCSACLRFPSPYRTCCTVIATKRPAKSCGI